MRNILSLVSAGIIGGLITLGGIYFFAEYTLPTKTEETPTYSKTVSYPLVNVKAGTKGVPFDFTEASEKSLPVVVHISAAESKSLAQQRRQQNQRRDPFSFFFGDDFFFGSPFNQQKQGTGSGVIISNDGYIVTNNHVVDFADEVQVTLYDGRKFNAKIIGVDTRTDLAVLKIEAFDLPILKYADSDKAKVGEWVLAVGNPFDLTSTVTNGIISAKGRDIDIIKDRNAIESFIQTDAAVNPGNSGGALVNVEGKLLGINTAIATPTGTFAGYSFAIPSNMVKKIVSDIIEFGGAKAYLGISIIDVDKELVEELNLYVDEGVYVDELTEGGSAEFAGLLPKDVIVRANGKKIANAPELIDIVDQTKIGDILVLTVNRNGETKKIPVKLKAG